MTESQLKSESDTLTPRQRTIVRCYFAMGCRTKVAAKALGVNTSRVRAVKATPAARAYLDALDAQACNMLVTAQAARLLAPMLP